MTVAVEQYLKVAATLEHLQQAEHPLKAVMITSAGPGEGKTLTTINIALTVSERCERHVLVIDGDLAHPTLHTLFQVPNLCGLGDHLREKGEPRIWPLKINRRLFLLPAGTARSGLGDPLTSLQMWRVIVDTSTRFDWVLLDVPPVSLLPDARVLANLLDGVLFVVDAARTDRAVAESAVRVFPRDRLLGLVLNRVPPPEISRL